MLKDGATPWEKEGRATIFQDQDETIAQGSIGWMKDGKDIFSDDDTRFLLVNDSFTITKLTKNDSGIK